MRSPLSLGCALVLALATTPAAARPGCDWRTVAWPGDIRAIETGLEAARDSARAFTPANAGSRTARALLERAMQPQRLGDITGTWQVRSIQVNPDHDFAYAYPFFRARIGRDACGFTFAKTTGSQRRTGVLRAIAGESRALAFLGGSTVNDDAARAYSRMADPRATAQAPSDTQGRLVRIGARELLMVMDVAPASGRFELYHLKR